MKNHPGIISAYILLAFCIFFVACGKDREPAKKPALECDLDNSFEEMKEWYFFKTGSYWIYQDEFSGVLDTMTVIHHREGDDQEDPYYGYEYTCESSQNAYYEYIFNKSFSIPCLTRRSCMCHKLFRIKSSNGQYVGEGRNFLFPAVEEDYIWVGAIVADDIGKVICQDIQEEYALGDSIYHQVVRWHVEIDNSEQDIPATYTVARNRGIIAYEFPSRNESWKLVEYRLIQD